MNILPDTSLYTSTVDRMLAAAAINRLHKEGRMMQTKDEDGEWRTTIARPSHDLNSGRDWRIAPEENLNKAQAMAA